jgi:hypothetical protein
MRNPIVLKRIAGEGDAGTEGLLRRAFLRFRLPLRGSENIEQTAARNRAERLFAVNYRSTWTR